MDSTSPTASLFPLRRKHTCTHTWSCCRLPYTDVHTVRETGCFSCLLQAISSHLSDFTLLWCHISEKCEKAKTPYFVSSTFKCFGQVGIDALEGFAIDFLATSMWNRQNKWYLLKLEARVITSSLKNAHYLQFVQCPVSALWLNNTGFGELEAVTKAEQRRKHMQHFLLLLWCFLWMPRDFQDCITSSLSHYSNVPDQSCLMIHEIHDIIHYIFYYTELFFPWSTQSIRWLSVSWCAALLTFKIIFRPQLMALSCVCQTRPPL